MTVQMAGQGTTNCCTTSSSGAPPRLSSLALRAIALAIVRRMLRWRRLEEFKADSRAAVHKWCGVSEPVRTSVLDTLDEAVTELNRWTEKHAQIFPEEENRAIRKAAFLQKAQSLDSVQQQRQHQQQQAMLLLQHGYRPQQCALRVLEKCEYLRIFYDCLVWRPTKLQIDDLATARHIVDIQCRDWAQMKFQFACCYAMDELLEDVTLFDKNRRRAFKKKLDSHPVYHFWLRVLDDRQEWARLYRPDRLIVDQRLMLVFRFAISNGFLELVQRLWNDLSEGQIETIGFLCWKKVCFNIQHPDMVKFLCMALCRINPKGMARMSWDNFLHKVYQTLDVDGMSREQQVECFQKLECLLENWCDPLRKAILARENFRVFTDSVYYNRPEPFLLFLDYLHDSEPLLSGARKEVERIWEQKEGNERVRFFRQQLIRRQTALD